ncbi:MAG: GyrI-like domain-containing protein [Candidatus Methanofastidiosa archaeon]|nr:GyrI-like domain-containing protein [Candidatus Methanofastidiosa archaeon]
MGAEPTEQIPIGRFSFLTRLSVKALRLYDKKGILVPAAKDACTNYRYYTLAQVRHGIMIGMLAHAGFGLSDLEVLLPAIKGGDMKTVTGMLRVQASRVRKEASRLEGLAAALEDSTRQGDVIPMKGQEPYVKDVPPLRSVCKRERGVYEQTIPQLINELCHVIYSPENQRQQACMSGPVIFICHDEEYQETDADIEIAIPITGRLTLPDPSMEIRELPGMQALCALHKGPYPLVGEAYERITAYAAAHGMKLCGPTRELYLNDPAEVPESELLTEVQFPLC